MQRANFGRWLGGRKRLPLKRRDRAAARFFDLESLEDRVVLAVTAKYNVAAGLLTILGDQRNNQIIISRTKAGKIRINNGAVKIQGRQPNAAKVNLIKVLGKRGNDTVILNEAKGTLPRANMLGGDGNDNLTGGSGIDQIFGEGGNDTLLGKAGSDLLLGGIGNDNLTGGDGDDQALGEAGDDRMIWNPGDDNDINEGSDGSDTVEVNGGNGGETFTVAANGARVRFDRTDPAPFSIDIGSSENLIVNGNGGDDNISAGVGLATLIKINMDGGAGNDNLLGSDGADVLSGGIGNDFIDGNRGDDVGLLGDGDDVFQWDPGEGSDKVEGQAGTDSLRFNGAGASENIDISANGGRVRFFRDVATITMDLDDTERIIFNALGGVDNVVVNDVSGTDLAAVDVNLAGALGGATGDTQVDTVSVLGTNAADTVEVLGAGTGFTVGGLHALVTVTNSESTDALVVNGQGGDDTLTATTLPALTAKLSLNGGDGNDQLRGGIGNDALSGGAGADFIDGNRGDDVALLGDGDDVFQWDPGDGSDVVEGQAGIDTLQFNGANAAEKIDILANGGRTRFLRDVASIAMDLDDVERINFEALGGADAITVNDLTGTDVTEVNLRLAGTLGGNTTDGQLDTVVVNGTNGIDNIGVAGNAASVEVTGLVAKVTITSADPTTDLLTVNALGGNDVVNGSGIAAGSIGFKVDGGDGDDVLTGGAGDDTLLGGPGADTLDGGPGTDVETQ